MTVGFCRFCYRAVYKDEDLEIKENIRFRMTKKESPKTATQTKSVKATAIFDDYGAKIGKLKEIYNSRPSKKTRGTNVVARASHSLR